MVYLKIPSLGERYQMMIFRAIFLYLYMMACCFGGPIEDYVKEHNRARLYLKCVKWEDMWVGEKGRKEKIRGLSYCTEYEKEYIRH